MYDTVKINVALHQLAKRQAAGGKKVKYLVKTPERVAALSGGSSRIATRPRSSSHGGSVFQLPHPVQPGCPPKTVAAEHQEPHNATLRLHGQLAMAHSNTFNPYSRHLDLSTGQL